MGTKSEWKQGILHFFDSLSPKERIVVMSPVRLYDDFLCKEVDKTNAWTVAGVNSGTAAINAALGGTARITTGAADDDDVDFASMLTFRADKACGFEVRIAVNDITYVAINVGFSDAQGEGADLIAMMLSGTTLTSTATDYAGFLYDPDADTDTIRCVAVKNGVDKSVINTGQAMVNGTYYVLRCELDASGNATYWLNGVQVGSHTAAITTSVALCMYIAMINHGEAAANTVDVDYIKVWQNR